MKSRKEILIVINSMELGGAQKSLVSFLRSLEMKGLSTEYDIDLLIAKPEGIFMDQIPAFVHQLEPVPELLWLGTPRGDALLTQHPCARGRLGKLKWILTDKQKLFAGKLNEEQRIWKNWKHLVPKLTKHYDTAISYMNGFPGYYVIDKVSADHKVLWIHNEYQKLQYDAAFDRPFYEAADRIITISETCVSSFVQIFPEFSRKISVLQNITIEADVREKGLSGEAAEFADAEGLKILSVGRLTEQKQFDLAVQAAAALAEQGLTFLWLIIGDGPDEAMLKELIRKNHLEQHLRLIGPRKNPYAYMAQCDVFVQTSRYEGKSIVIDEAKVFRKPLVVTDYPTAKDTVADGKNGLICKMDAAAVAGAILRVRNEPELRKTFAENLSRESADDTELQKYRNRMLEW